MASIRCLPLQFTPFHRQPTSPNLQKLPTLPTRALKTPRIVLKIRASSSLQAHIHFPTTEDEVIKVISNSEERGLPCIRTYENELGRLRLTGDVNYQQALTAAAADGGEAAKEQLESGKRALVVETVYQGTAGERSTISTRLFLPTIKVIEKARKLRGTITEEMLSSTSSVNILAMTFKQVVLQNIKGLEIVLFAPGTERKMEDFEYPREGPAAFMLSSVDEKVISVLAEVMCKFALENTKKNFVEGSNGKAWNSFLPWFWKPERIMSRDSSVILYKMNDSAISQNAKRLLETFNSIRGQYKPVERKLNSTWGKSSVYTELERIGGLEFSLWVSEYIPAYKLLIDADKLGEVDLEGWKRSEANTWEVILTHSQLVELAVVLDMYYEDVHTLPDKQLPSIVSANYTHLPQTKKSSSFLRTISVSLATGIFIFAVSILGRIYMPHLYNGRRNGGNIPLPVATEVNYIRNQFVEPTKLESLCVSIVEKIKVAYGWLEDTKAESEAGAWIGEVPDYMRLNEANLSGEAISVISPQLGKTDADIPAPSVEDIASYQVVMSLDGKVVGFQPTNRVAVNYWAANPLVSELYGGRKHLPGIFEPGLSIPLPKEVVVFELLMSVNPQARFALARPIH